MQKLSVEGFSLQAGLLLLLSSQLQEECGYALQTAQKSRLNELNLPPTASPRTSYLLILTQNKYVLIRVKTNHGNFNHSTILLIYSLCLVFQRGWRVCGLVSAGWRWQRGTENNNKPPIGIGGGF